MDLILGARSERDEDVVATIEVLLDGPIAPPHLSCYLLTVEKGTPLSRDVNRHPDDDVLAHRYELLDELLSNRGYDWYEVSNWSKPGHQCRHNQLYWDQGDYLGIGVAAHSHRTGRRWWNIANLETYLLRSESGESTLGGEEFVDEASAAFEAKALQLRTRNGVPKGSFDDESALVDFLAESEEQLVLTRRGRLMADELVRRLKA
jgi:oxygen-independent coproporphyrinogen-3 oxidase